MLLRYSPRDFGRDPSADRNSAVLISAFSVLLTSFFPNPLQAERRVRRNSEQDSYFYIFIYLFFSTYVNERTGYQHQVRLVGVLIYVALYMYCYFVRE